MIRISQSSNDPTISSHHQCLQRPQRLLGDKQQRKLGTITVLVAAGARPPPLFQIPTHPWTAQPRPHMDSHGCHCKQTKLYCTLHVQADSFHLVIAQMHLPETDLNNEFCTSGVIDRLEGVKNSKVFIHKASQTSDMHTDMSSSSQLLTCLGIPDLGLVGLLPQNWPLRVGPGKHLIFQHQTLQC